MSKMKLNKVKLKNFRSYKDETEIIFDDLNCFIGKNDIGKSSVLEALNAFFNNNIDGTDLSNNADGTDIEITCTFSGFPSTIVLDTSEPTKPKEEGILNSEDLLEIKRIFSVSKRVTKSVYLICNHPNDERILDILSWKKAKLKAKAEELGVDLSDVNKRKNPPMREAIRSHIGGGRSIREIKVDGSLDSEDNLKTIWRELKKILPVFSLFKVDRELDDKDQDVQNPMKVAVNEALSLPEIQGMLEKIEEKVKEKSTEVADKTIEKLKDIDPSLAEKLKSEFGKDPSWNRIFDLTLLNDEGIPLNKRGSGVRRLVLLSFFQAKAEKEKAESDAPSIIYAIEEPETSQHPKHQMILIEALIRLSEEDNIQVMFTSHSANLVRDLPIKSIKYLSNEGNSLKVQYGWKWVEEEQDDQVIEKVIESLGILPNPTDQVKVIVYLEGNNDVNALIRYSEILNNHDTEFINLNDTPQVAYVITGGSSLQHYLDKKYLQGLNKAEFHLYDNDKQDYRDAVDDINGDGDEKKMAFNTSKDELENYLHHSAIVEAYNENGLNDLALDEIEDQDDVPFKVAQAVYSTAGGNWNDLEPEKQKEKADQKKKFLNTFAVEKMTLERLEERNGLEDLKTWLVAIKTLCE